jgi:uncharacterized phiE125 gp8 family phage protein
MIKLEKQVKASEPLTLDEVKEWLKVDGDDDDAVIAAIITEVRELVEEYLGISIVSQQIMMAVQNARKVSPPYGPVNTIVSVQNSTGDDVTYTWDGFVVSMPHGTVSVTAGSSPTMSVITYLAGYTQIPAGLKLGLKQVIAWLYENRGDSDKLPYMIYQNANLQPYRQKVWFT